MKTPAMSAPGRAGRGAVDQKFVKYLSESSNFVKKTPTLFSFEILGNEMRDSQLCKVYSSGGTFCFGTSSRKYRRSKSAPAGVLHAVVWRRLAVSVERNRKNANSVFFVTESKVDISIWLCSESFYPRELLEAIILKASPP